MTKCPHCGADVSPSALVCRLCNKRLDVAPAVAAAPPAPVAPLPHGRALLAPGEPGSLPDPGTDRLPGRNFGGAFLIVCAVGAGLLGGLSLSPATTGVGLIGGGCLLAILARCSQAEYHHKRLLHVLQRRP